MTMPLGAAEFDLIDKLFNLGGLGVCVAVLLLIVWTNRKDAKETRDAFADALEKMTAAHEFAMKEKRESFQNALNQIVSRNDAAMDRLVDELKQVVERVNSMDAKLDAAIRRH